LGFSRKVHLKSPMRPD